MQNIPGASEPNAIAIHPAAELFPLLAGTELQALADDIQEHGLLQPVVLYEGAVLDGRNRVAACRLAGVQVATVEWDGMGDPADFVVSVNLKRRHLDESQRALVAGRLKVYHEAAAAERRRAGLRRGADPPVRANLPEREDEGRAREVAARALNVSARSVEHASVVLREGGRELVLAVEAGAVAVSTAAAIAGLPAPEQAEVVARGDRAILEAAKRIRAGREAKRREERMAKLRDIANGDGRLDGAVGRFPVLYADPPWRYEHVISGNREVENHYPTMDVDTIKGLDVASLATEDAALFLWATCPLLPEALGVLVAWGFTYRTCLVWVKPSIGPGYWVRQRHELLLLATRGKMPTAAPTDRPDSVVEAPRGRHSEKPSQVYALIERMYPNLPRIELFARARRAGWAAWGNEAGCRGRADARV